MSDITFTPEQEAAITKAVTWMDNFEFQKQKVMRMIGPAGTGKTSIMKEIGRRTKRRLLYGAFAGKAAMVLRSKGCEPSETLHKTLYEPRGGSIKHYKEELAILEGLSNEAERKTQENKLEQMRIAMQAPGFVKKLPAEFHIRTGFAFDEVSMVDKYVGGDAEALGFPILAVGDPFQLPAIMGDSYFFPKGFTPDIELKQIHRQAAGSPVLRLATAVRGGNLLPYGRMGDSEIVRQLPLKDYLEFDQILCGTNKMRKQVNSAMRKLMGRTKFCEPGDKLICLQNNYEVGVMNGSQWEVVKCQIWENPHGHKFYVSHLKSLDEPGVELKRAFVHVNPLLEGTSLENPHWTPMLTGVAVGLVMTHANAVTVHKAQGSQWNSVAVLDDWNGSHYAQWLYTAITRAALRVTVVRKNPR